MFALASLDEVPATANLKCDPDLALDLRERYEQVSRLPHEQKTLNTVEIESGIPDLELRKNDRPLLRSGREASPEI